VASQAAGLSSGWNQRQMPPETVCAMRGHADFKRICQRAEDNGFTILLQLLFRKPSVIYHLFLEIISGNSMIGLARQGSFKPPREHKLSGLIHKKYLS
jgi:hypothetical protein